MKAGMSLHSLPFSVSMHSPFSLFSCGGPHMPPEAQESLNTFTSVILIGSLRFFLSLLTLKVLLLTIMDRTMKLWRKDKTFTNIAKDRRLTVKGTAKPTLPSQTLPRQAGEGATICLSSWNPSLWGSSVISIAILECVGWKQRLKTDFNFQFVDFVENKNLSNATNCNIGFIVGETKLLLSFVFSSLLTGLK